MAGATNLIEKRCKPVPPKFLFLEPHNHWKTFQMPLLLLYLLWALAKVPAGYAQDVNDNTNAVEQGRYILHAGNCISCHTNFKGSGSFLAGGRELVTEFGSFYAPNITPHPVQGIGNWTFEDFQLAMTNGVSPQGHHYYPVFPYAAYSGMKTSDLEDLWSYLQTVPPAPSINRSHKLKFPFSFRPALLIWKKLFFQPERFHIDPEHSSAWNRGFYLVKILGHCQECHTPRNFLGALKSRDAFSGTKFKVDDEKIPNITPDIESGIGDWDTGDISWFLQTGFLPNGDVAGSSMAEVIEHSTSHLTRSDREAVAIFLGSLRAIHNPSLITRVLIDSSEDNW